MTSPVPEVEHGLKGLCEVERRALELVFQGIVTSRAHLDPGSPNRLAGVTPAHQVLSQIEALLDGMLHPPGGCA